MSHKHLKLKYMLLLRFVILEKDTILKEATYLSQTMGWQLIDISIVLVFRIISTDSNYLVVLFSLCSD